MSEQCKWLTQYSCSVFWLIWTTVPHDSRGRAKKNTCYTVSIWMVTLGLRMATWGLLTATWGLLTATWSLQTATLQQLQWCSWQAVPAPYIKRCQEYDVNTCYMYTSPILLKKKSFETSRFFFILATDTIQSCIEAADKLFQHIFGHKSMEHVNAYFYIYIHVHCLFYSEKKAIFF